METEKTIQETLQVLFSRTISLLHAIDENENFSQKYQWLASDLLDIASALQKSPVDIDTLRKRAYGIFRTFDGPLHNEIEQEAYDLVGEIGLLRRKLKERQGKS